MFYRFFTYILYQWRRKRWAHSAFVYDFICIVLRNQTGKNEYKKIEQIRKKLRKNHQTLYILYAGGHADCGSILPIDDVVRYFSVSKSTGNLLFQLVRRYNLQHIVEFGTAFGLSAAYMAMANPGASILTVEQSPEVSAIAEETFKMLKLNNIERINADFDAVIKHFPAKFKYLDLLYVKVITSRRRLCNYFHFIKQYASPSTIFVLEGIYKTKEMTSVWKSIQADPDVSITIDLYSAGLVFFRQKIAKQNFVL
jgi:predicted O-methyltransferase YrrM